jgi:neurotransmitter:Na+ symporter, NSS family
MAFGMFFLVIFLVLFLFATLTSAFSMLEVIVAAHSKDDVEKRPKSTWMFGLLIFLVGIPSALSFGVGGEFIIFGNIVFDNMDFLVSNILMPLGAFLIAVFVPMKMGKEELFAELRQEEHLGRKLFTGWYIFIRYVAPVVILLVFLDVAGVFTFIFDVALGR